jgi:hypothetical protein
MLSNIKRVSSSILAEPVHIAVVGSGKLVAEVLYISGTQRKRNVHC